MKTLFFVPVGGLGNRMRAVASAVALAGQRGGSVRVGWFRDWALNAPFAALFENPDYPGLSIADVPYWLYWSLDRPRRKNGYLPKVFQRMLFDRCLYEDEMWRLYEQHTDFSWYPLEESRIYMASCHPFFHYEHTLMQRLFRPVASIRNQIEVRSRLFTERTIGVHIRRSDNVWSIQESPLDAFYCAIDAEAERYTDLSIYLATDSEEVKQAMKLRYPGRVMTSESPADRNSVNGIQEGVTDLYTLAATQHIYGSFRSSFSELAAELGNVPLTIVRKS